MTAQTPRAFPPKTLLSIAIGGLLLGSGAQAATITVNSTTDPGTAGTCTLRQAINSINLQATQGNCSASGSFGSSDTILFASNVTGTIRLNGSQLSITRSMHIQGPGKAVLAVDGDMTSRVLSVTTPDGVTGDVAVSIHSLTIQNGLAYAPYPNYTPNDNLGGGIFAQRSSLNLTDSQVSGNSAYYGGGGIYAYQSSVTLTNSTLSGNKADYEGGGIFANLSSLTLTGSTVTGNTASDDGGGIEALNNSPVTLIDSMVTGNSASRDGGGMFASQSAVTLTDSTVSSNTAGYYGGGIEAISYSSVTLTNSKVLNNLAGADGGGVDVYNASSLTLHDSEVIGNSARYGGGLSAWYNASVMLTNSSVSENSAGGGGGIVASQSLIMLTNSRVSGNSADFGAGAAADYDSQLTLVNSRVAENLAADKGGGIAASVNSSVTLINSSLSSNSAFNDGGGIEANNSPVMLISSTLSDNSAGRFGGGVEANNNASLTLTNSTLSGNSAGSLGGGIDAFNNSPVTLVNSTLLNNGSASGGGVSVENSSLALTNSLLAGNSTDCVRDASSTLTGGFNLIGNAAFACGLTNGNDGNIVGVAVPRIGPLADNSCVTPVGNPNDPPEFYGCVQTHALLPGSPALDRATPSGAPDEDQRGVARPQGSGFDIGAFELGKAQGIPDPTGDGEVDEEDVWYVRDAVLGVADKPNGDVNGDTKLDVLDVLYVIDWIKTHSP